MLCKLSLFTVAIVICSNVAVSYHNVFHGEFHCGSSCTTVLHRDCGSTSVCYTAAVVILQCYTVLHCGNSCTTVRYTIIPVRPESRPHSLAVRTKFRKFCN